MSCGHELTAKDLVPLFSWLIHRGRCRHCGEKVSVRYPLTEASFMLLSVVLYITILGFGVGVAENNPDNVVILYGTGITVARVITFLKYWFLTGCLFVIALTDIESFEIPDGTLILGAIAWIIFSIIEVALGIHDIKWIIHHVLAGFIIGAGMLLMSLIMDRILHRDSLGGGDIKLYALLGLYLGYAGSYELILLSCILGLLFAGARKAVLPGASDEFPFGPAIAVSGYLLLILSGTITNWYLGLFLL